MECDRGQCRSAKVVIDWSNSSLTQKPQHKSSPRLDAIFKHDARMPRRETSVTSHKMVSLQDLIQNGKVRGPAARSFVRDISLNGVVDVQSEIRTRHGVDGKALRHTVLTFILDGSELLVTDQANTEPQYKDATTTTIPPPHSVNDRHSMSAQNPDNEIAVFKRDLEKKANKALQKQLHQHNESYRKRAEKSSQNYNRLVNKTLNIIQAKCDTPQHGDISFHVSNKLAAKMLANNPKIFAEYQKACEESLIEYRADMKLQYQQHLNDIELQCRDWMKANRGSNLKIGALEGLTNIITQATHFAVPLPVIDRSVSDRFTDHILAADMEDSIHEFTELAAKPVEEGGLSFARESVKVEPLFDDRREPNDGGNDSMARVPAALLPMYESTSWPFNSQTSATLSIIDRRNLSRAGQSTRSSALGTPAFGIPAFGTKALQVQGAATQGHFVNQFTLINRPYVSPYPALPPSQSAPDLIPSNHWYGTTDSSLADRSRPSAPGADSIPSTQGSALSLGSQNETRGMADIEQKPEYPPYPFPLQRGFRLPSASGSLPRAGVFKLHTITQPAPQRFEPILITPARQFETSMNSGNDEWLKTPRISSAMATSKINSIPTNSTNEYSNSYVDTSLYDADCDVDEDGDDVPPPAIPVRQQQPIDQSTNYRPAPGRTA
ncbi:hypothetical protein BKA64DRAFT_301461 [Cadophora sp. MPI-SDFR-AT-0126]|nr:hypothetical protein BKA64DRAFT_301461 [Leotiomycetes sp. MPI-SDFR-AT-0126]